MALIALQCSKQSEGEIQSAGSMQLLLHVSCMHKFQIVLQCFRHSEGGKFDKQVGACNFFFRWLACMALIALQCSKNSKGWTQQTGTRLAVAELDAAYFGACIM